MKRTLVACVLTASLLWSAMPATANDTAVGGAGGTVMPMSEDGVRLEAETVQVMLHRRFATYRVDFQFRNEGPPKTLRLGFPFPQGGEPESPHVPPASVRAWQDGTPLAVTRDTGTDNGDQVEWWLHDVTFKTGDTFVRVEYYAAPTVTAGWPPDEVLMPAGLARDSAFVAVFPYTVHTGAGWAGTIGKSIIRYTLADDFEGFGIPEMMRYHARSLERNGMPEHSRVLGSFTNPDPSVYQWVFEDFEPTFTLHEGSPYNVGLHVAWPHRQTASPDASFGEGEPAPTERISASSWLDLGEYQYRPDAIYDGYPSSAWAEGANGSGAGEWVRLTFADARNVREVQVLPGYAKRPDLFAKYNRPRTLEVEFSDGTRETLPLRDEPVLQTFPVTAEAEWAQVTIRDVYRGTTRDETYISEIEFAEAATPEFATFEQLMGIPAPEPADVFPAEETTPVDSDVETASIEETAAAETGEGPATWVWVLLGLALAGAASGGAYWLKKRSPAQTA